MKAAPNPAIIIRNNNDVGYILVMKMLHALHSRVDIPPENIIINLSG